MDLKWKTELRLTYRMFGRQMEDTDLAFDQVTQYLAEKEPARISFGHVKEDFWPLRPESREDTEKRGIFVSETAVGLSVVIREFTATITCDSFDDAEARLARILNDAPCKFAFIEITRAYLTDHVAD